MEFRVLLLGFIVIGVPMAVFLGFTALARVLLREQPGRAPERYPPPSWLSSPASGSGGSG